MNDVLRSLPQKILHMHRNECGQALVLMILGLVVLVGMTALTIDVGYGYSSKAKAQNAADAAGYAAGIAHLLEGSSDEDAKQAALDAAAENGYTNSSATTKVTVNIPPESGPNAGNHFFVEVIINDQEGTYFADVLGVEFWDIAARSVTTVKTQPKPYSIITLNPSQCKATEVDGSVVINIEGAGTFTQSNCSTDAFYTEGSINVDTEDNDVVGGWIVGGNVNPAPSKAYPIVDPLAGLEAPEPPTEPVHPCPTFSGTASTLTLEPGVYECTIDPPGQWAIEFLPGDYHLKGGVISDGGGSMVFGEGIYTIGGVGLKLTGGGSITADGAVFYIEAGSVQLTGSGDMDFTAPTSGPYEGVVIFQARNNTNQVTITGNSVQDGWGTLYAPEAPIDFSGNTNTSFQFIGDTFYAHGQSNANIVYQGNKTSDVPYIWIAE